MAINQAQVTQAKISATNLQVTLAQLQTYLAVVQDLMDRSFVITNTIRGISINTNISAGNQSTILNEYTSLKATLVSQFNTLP